MLHEVGPETYRGGARLDVGADIFHDGTYGPLRHAVELMYVRGAARVAYRPEVEHLLEVLRKKFAGVVGVKRPDDLGGVRFADVDDGVELGDERAHFVYGLGLAPQEVGLLIPSVIVDEY